MEHVRRRVHYILPRGADAAAAAVHHGCRAGHLLRRHHLLVLKDIEHIGC